MSIETILEDNELKKLRERSIIKSDEIAIKAGDIFFAKNILTNEKRIIEVSFNDDFNISTESVGKNNKQLLKG